MRTLISATYRILTKCCVFLVILISLNCNNNSNNTLDYLSAFSKVYGYVKYFHPSDEAFEFDWNKFAVYGCKSILDCNSKDELVNQLSNLFHPIAPGVSFSLDDTFESNIYAGSDTDTSNLRVTFWQHEGVSFNAKVLNEHYRSRRINRYEKDSLLFETKIKSGDHFIEEIIQGVYCRIPLSLLCNNESTMPRPNLESLKSLKSEIKNCSDSIESPEVRFANIVIF